MIDKQTFRDMAKIRRRVETIEGSLKWTLGLLVKMVLERFRCVTLTENSQT